MSYYQGQNFHHVQEFVPTYQVRSDFFNHRVTEGERDPTASEVVKTNIDNLVAILSTGKVQRTRLLQPTRQIRPQQIQVRQSLRKRQNRSTHRRITIQQNGQKMIVCEFSFKSKLSILRLIYITHIFQNISNPL